MKTLEKKLKKIRSGKYKATDFIIADAKDADMGFGVAAPGPTTDANEGENGWKSREQYLEAMTELVNSRLIDITLMSASSAEILQRRGVFRKSKVTPAIRMNDTTDIWMARGGVYRQFASEAFASADLEAAVPYANLGLYSITFCNDLHIDKANLDAYKAFRLAARKAGMRHFLEVFNPPIDIGIKAEDMGFYINDMIVKALAGVTEADAPLFLKLQFNGSKAMEELSHYDPLRLVPGILGGASGTTRDTFELVFQAHQAGARVALFGRKINLSESPLELVSLMRQVVTQALSPTDAVRAYHEQLKSQGISPQRSLRQDLRVTDQSLK
ncbi:MAG: hypothetical protein AB8B63_10925 [Granulosicoccus sp.]